MPSGDGNDFPHEVKEPESYAPTQEGKGEDAVSPQAVNPARVIRTSYRYVIPFLFVTTALTYIDRANLSFASLQFLPLLGFSQSQYGLGTGVFYLGYALFQIPSNLIITRVGAPLWLSIMIIAWGCIAALTSTMRSFRSFLALRFFLGMAESGCFPGSFFHLMQFFTSREIGFAYASVASSTALSGVIGAPLAAGLLFMDGLGGLRGWQWIFVIEGCCTILYGLVLKFLLAEKPASAYFLAPQERVWLQGRQDKLAAAANATHASAGKWYASIIDWKIWYLGICYAILQFGIVACVFFSPFIISSVFYGGDFSSKPKKLHFENDRAEAWHAARVALIATSLWAPVGAVMIGVSFSAKKFNERHLHAAIPSLLAGICFFLVPLTVKASPVGGYILLVVAACGVWAPHGPMWSWPKTFLHGEGAAVGIAIFNTLGAVGGFVGPFVVGSLVEAGGYRDCMFTLGGLFLVLSVLIILYRPKSIEEGVELADNGEVHILDPLKHPKKSGFSLPASLSNRFTKGGQPKADTAVNSV